MTDKKIYILQHVSFEGPGMILPILNKMGLSSRIIHLYKNEKIPTKQETDRLIVMGGPMNMEDEEQYPWLRTEKKLIRDLIESGKPVLGICLGAQLIAHVMGNDVYPAKDHEIGWYPILLTKQAEDHSATKSWKKEPMVYHWHGNTFDLPVGAVHLASTKLCKNQAFILNENVIGLQFHLEIGRPEVEKMIENWGRYRKSGPSVQSPEEMLQKSDAAAETKKMLEQLLEYWISGDW